MAAEQQAERGTQRLDLRALEAAAAQADDVQANQPRAVAEHGAERNDVRFHARHAADHRGAADAHVLMDCGSTADHRVVADRHVPAHHHVICNNYSVADPAVVRDVRHRHDQAVGADVGDASPGNRAAVDGDVLAHLRAGSDLDARGLAAVFQVLRRHAHGAERVHDGAFADMRVAVDHHVADQRHSVIEHRIGADMAPGADAHAGADRGAGRHDRGRMDGSHCIYLSATLSMIMAA